jgi:carboxyl-terminal processing protease
MKAMFARPARTTALIAAAFVGGAVAATAAGALPAKYSPYRKLAIFTRALSYIENNYVEDVEQERLVYGAIKGMTGELDPHTSFLTPDEYRQMKADTSGEYPGIGIEVDRKQGERDILVVAPIDGAPAAKAGILAGDHIVKIDGRPTDDLQISDAIKLMRGNRGTRVTLTVTRKGEPAPRDYAIVRDNVKVVSVTARALEPGYGYLKLAAFQDRTDHDMEEHLERLAKAAPGGKLKGLVLDLRGNPGGLLDQAVRVADLFLESGLIVKTVGKGGRVIDEERAHSRGTQPGYPLIVMVNGSAASASEIVAGALQDHKRAVILGTPSFGKGSVQTVIELEDGSGLKLTVARYYTPAGRSIQEHGISPDIYVEQLRAEQLKGAVDDSQEPSERERDLKRRLRNDQIAAKGAPTVTNDYQLRTALDYLKAFEIFRSEGGAARVSAR